MNEIGPVAQGFCADAAAAVKKRRIATIEKQRLQQRQLVRGRAFERRGTNLDAKLPRPLEERASFVGVAMHSTEDAVLEIRVRLSQGVSARAADLQRFFEKRNTVQVRAQAEYLAQPGIYLGQGAR